MKSYLNDTTTILIDFTYSDFINVDSVQVIVIISKLIVSKVIMSIVVVSLKQNAIVINKPFKSANFFQFCTIFVSLANESFIGKGRNLPQPP